MCSSGSNCQGCTKSIIYSRYQRLYRVNSEMYKYSSTHHSGSTEAVFNCTSFKIVYFRANKHISGRVTSMISCLAVSWLCVLPWLCMSMFSAGFLCDEQLLTEQTHLLYYGLSVANGGIKYSGSSPVVEYGRLPMHTRTAWSGAPQGLTSHTMRFNQIHLAHSLLALALLLLSATLFSVVRPSSGRPRSQPFAQVLVWKASRTKGTKVRLA